MPLIDENARTDADDTEPLEQVIDLNPTHILPSVDENAVDSMDFENQLGYLQQFRECCLLSCVRVWLTCLIIIFRKTFDMANEVALEIAKNIHSRSEEQAHEIIDKEDSNEPVDSVPIMEMSDSDIADDEVNEENDGSSLGECAETFMCQSNLNVR